MSRERIDATVLKTKLENIRDNVNWDEDGQSRPSRLDAPRPMKSMLITNPKGDLIFAMSIQVVNWQFTGKTTYNTAVQIGPYDVSYANAFWTEQEALADLYAYGTRILELSEQETEAKSKAYDAKVATDDVAGAGIFPVDDQDTDEEEPLIANG